MKNKDRKVGEITGIILRGILCAGVVVIVSASPGGYKMIPKLLDYFAWKKKRGEIEKKRFYNAFYRLRKNGLVNMKYRGKQLYIELTAEGKRYVKKNQIDYLKIKKPLRWDKRWRVLIFDIKEKHKIKREALRGKLKELGLFRLQDSVWVCPYKFQKEIEILRNFFGLTKNEMTVIVANEIEDDASLKDYFRLRR